MSEQQVRALSGERQELREWDVRHFIHPVTHIAQLEQTGPRIIVEAEGIFVRDIDGKEYIDGTAGLWLCNVGHGRRELIEAARRQLETLDYFPTFWGFSNPPAIRLARRLAEIAPPGLSHAFFCSGGSEAVETAIKLARLYHALRGEPQRVKVISRSHSYHGVSYGALSATGLSPYWGGYGPLVPGFVHAMAPYCYRCELGLEYPACGLACVRALEATLRAEGPETVAAVIAEPVMGAGGVIVPPEDYLAELAEVCRRYGVLFIADEVICGFGRTGRMFAVERYGVVPDLMTLAKGITSGYVPLGAVLVHERVYEVLRQNPQALMHGYTYSGHPTACAVALANLDVLERERLPQNADRVGRHLLARLQELARFPQVGEVRGVGLLCAVEYVQDRKSRERFPNDPEGPIARLAQALYRRGLITRTMNSMTCLSPPLILTEQQADLIADIMEDAIREVFG